MASRTATRVAALLLLVGVAATACSDDEPELEDLSVTAPSTAVDGTPTSPTPAETAPPPTPTAPPSPTATDDAPPTTAPPATTPPPATPDPTEPTAAEPDQRTPADDAAGVSVNGRAILRADRPSLVIEVDAQQGVQPHEEALAHLLSVLEEVTDKPAGIRVEGADTFTSTTTTWNAEELRRTTAEHRTTATDDDQVSIHVLYVAGSHAEDGSQTNAIGLAYSASTVALFPDRWQGLSSLLGSSQAIERAVLVHEVGHLLGLVNLGYTSDLDHEDPDHPGHSDNKGSVMFHAVETTLIGQAFSGPPPSTFDEADRSDLEGLRTGRL